MGRPTIVSIEKIVELYESGLTCNQVASQLHIGTKTVRNAVSALGHTIRPKGQRTFTYLFTSDIKRLYSEGKSIAAIGRELGIASSTVRRNLGYQNITTELGRNRKHFYNEEFFDKIDTEEKSYWLGFITADGNVSYSNSVIIGLSSVDDGHIKKFAQCVDASGLVKNLLSNVKISLSSKHMCDALYKLGVRPCKSSNVMPATEWFPVNLHRHYWRGVIDGDGSIFNCYDKRNNTVNWYVALCGNKYIVDGFRNFVISQGIETQRSSVLVPGYPDWYRRVSFVGSFLPFNVASLLYGNSSIFLDRKYSKVEELNHYISEKYPNGHRRLMNFQEP